MAQGSWLMARGSCLMAQGSWLKAKTKVWRVGLSNESWALRHERWTIKPNNRRIVFSINILDLSERPPLRSGLASAFRKPFRSNYMTIAALLLTHHRPHKPDKSWTSKRRATKQNKDPSKQLFLNLIFWGALVNQLVLLSWSRGSMVEHLFFVFVLQLDRPNLLRYWSTRMRPALVDQFFCMLG